MKYLTGKQDTDGILSVEILHGYDSEATLIENKEDFKFLKRYQYKGVYPADRLYELFLFPSNPYMTINLKDQEPVQVHLLDNGEIVWHTTIDEKSSFHVFSADSDHTLNKDRLIQLLKKYHAYSE